MITLTKMKNKLCHFELTGASDLIGAHTLKQFQFIQDLGTNTIYLGMGEVAQLSQNDVKQIFGKIAKICEKFHISQCSINCEKLENIPSIAHLVSLGLILGAYGFSVKPVDTAYEFQLMGNLSEKELAEHRNLAQSICFTRDMVNTPGNLLRPVDFCEKIKDYLSDTDIEVEILDGKTLEEKGLNGLVSVGFSSKFKPYLVILRYKPLPEMDCFGLVGKGVTCDTGGYSLKRDSLGVGIKGDMAGAASVVSVMKSLWANQVQKNVTALLPICENRISDSALLPGDVITMYDQTTVEILNTDAEGRLILGDAIAYGVKNEHLMGILDVATLTGQVWTTLGYSITGVLSSNDSLYEKLDNASKITGEHFLRFPYFKEHETMIKSNVADIKNLGDAHSGTITAGVFLKHFAKDIPWIHLDIAGTAWVDQPIYEYQKKGATGTAISTMYHMLRAK